LVGSESWRIKKKKRVRKLILFFNNHIRRSDGAVVRSARDARLPQVPEAPIGSHRQRLAPTRAAVSPVEDFAVSQSSIYLYVFLIHGSNN
jgi:hypothetical protein